MRYTPLLLRVTRAPCQGDTNTRRSLIEVPQRSRMPRFLFCHWHTVSSTAAACKLFLRSSQLSVHVFTGTYAGDDGYVGKGPPAQLGMTCWTFLASSCFGVNSHISVTVHDDTRTFAFANNLAEVSATSAKYGSLAIYADEKWVCARNEGKGDG